MIRSGKQFRFLLTGKLQAIITTVLLGIGSTLAFQKTTLTGLYCWSLLVLITSQMFG